MVKVNYGLLIWKMVVHLYRYMRTSQALTRPDNTTNYLKGLTYSNCKDFYFRYPLNFMIVINYLLSSAMKAKRVEPFTNGSYTTSLPDTRIPS